MHRISTGWGFLRVQSGTGEEKRSTRKLKKDNLWSKYVSTDGFQAATQKKLKAFRALDRKLVNLQ